MSQNTSVVPFLTDPNQIAKHRPYYKKYHSLRFDAVRSPQQIQRWNCIIQAVYKFADKVNSEIPFLTKNSDKACLSFQKKQLPALPSGYQGDQKIYYKDTYNINLFDYKVRRRFNVSSIPQYNYGYNQAMALYRKYHPPTTIIQDIPITENSFYEISKKDRNILTNNKDLFFRRTLPPDTDSNTTMSDISYTSATKWELSVEAPT
ncbi:hypothetical protein RhiirB3_528810 [Rhizophagus irregularis]|nr:hypothetical protein RhiirB3_528810 [Rhizophagus irregularis]